MNLPGNMTIAATVLAVVFVAGGVLGYQMGSPKPKNWTVTSAPSVRQRDGSLIAQWAVNPEAKPKQVLPPGAKLDRVLSAVVTPRTSGSHPEDGEGPAPVTVDVSLVTMPDGMERAILSSPDGEVTVATDQVVRKFEAPKEQTHTFISSYDLVTHDATLGYAHRLLKVGKVSVDLGGLLVQKDRRPSLQVLLVVRL